MLCRYIIWEASLLTSQIVCSVPQAATTVSYTPDDGCDGRPKHIELFSSK